MSIIGAYCQLDLGPEVGRSKATQIPLGRKVAADAVRPVSQKAVTATVFFWQHPHPTLVVPTPVWEGASPALCQDADPPSLTLWPSSNARELLAILQLIPFMLPAATVRCDGYISTRCDKTAHHTATYPTPPHHRSDICPAAPAVRPGVEKAMPNASRAGLRDSRP